VLVVEAEQHATEINQQQVRAIAVHSSTVAGQDGRR